MLILIPRSRAWWTLHPARNRVHGCFDASKIARRVYSPVRDKHRLLGEEASIRIRSLDLGTTRCGLGDRAAESLAGSLAGCLFLRWGRAASHGLIVHMRLPPGAVSGKRVAVEVRERATRGLKLGGEQPGY